MYTVIYTQCMKKYELINGGAKGTQSKTKARTNHQIKRP
jgi:hypothetical protein